MDPAEAMEQAETPEQVQHYQDIDALAGVMVEDQKLYNYLTSLYQFSEAYEAEWNDKWTQYDAMEQRRIEVGAQRLDWQEIVERWRDEDAKMRIEYVDSLADIMGKVPLYYALHVYASEQLGEELEIDRLHSWSMAMRDWSRFRELYESSADFRGHLSPNQQTSFRILDDWWNSRYSPASDIEAFVASVELLSPVASVTLPTSSSFPYRWTSHSYYHTHCMELFFREFHAMEWEPHVPRPKLRNLIAVRGEAARHAIHMRFAWATHRSLVLETPEDEGPRLPEYMKPVREMDFWKDNIYFQEPQPGDVAQEGYVEKVQSLTNPPLYLWDVQEKKTVRTSDFEKCPDYMCVSHTWGRWTYRPPQMVQVPNVPWEIKANTLYDVRDVPDMLLGLNTEYVWLDLFCLPQDDDDPEHHSEVGNQTAIFRRSKACVAWLNDVEEWTVTSAALSNVALRYLRNTCIHPDLEVSDEVIEATYDAAHSPSELLKRGMRDEPSSWFSSLWTLQETVLCPDLRLCTRTMNVLSDGRGTPISLSTLLTLVKIPTQRPTIPTRDIIGFQNTVHQVPPACQTLQSLSLKTQLGHVMRVLTPIDVMINANLRACKRSRAVAIMSALDVVEWYKERKPDKDGKVSSTGYDDDELILGTFPLSFVREAAKKFGSAFYTAMSDMNSHRMEKFDTLTGYGDYQVGSMMPFTRNHGWVSSVYGAITTSQLRKRDHESVATWVIQENAAVRIRQAGILASSEDAPQEDKPIEALMTIMRSEKIEGSERRKKTADTDPKADMRAKLKELAGKKSIYYAVVLSDDFGQQFGLVLQTAKIRLPTPGIKRYLCKVGFFWTLQMTDPVPSTKVNWVVA